MKKEILLKARFYWYSFTHFRIYVWRPKDNFRESWYSSVYYDAVTYYSIGFHWFTLGWNFCGE